MLDSKTIRRINAAQGGFRHGCWTWIRQPDTESGREVWVLSPDCIEVLGSRWVLKDYGPAAYEGSPFSGWRFVGSGPSGPMHADRASAAEYAREYLNTRALLRKRELQHQLDAIDNLFCS